ncbi:MAG: hypothetical protein ACLQPH_10025 [Acidimicrobiales bacterium]
MPPARRRTPWRIIAATGVVIVLVGMGFVAVRYLFREHPGPEPLSSVVKAFKGKGSITVGSKLAYGSPTQGIYALRGQGMERIVFPPNSQQDGAVMPASVTYIANGCWRWHLDYNVAHWEEYDFCPHATVLLLAAVRNSQSWDFGVVKTNNLARFTCGPGAVVLPKDPKPGQTLEWPCTGTNTSVPGRTFERVTVRIVGIGTLRIGRAVVPTVHEFQQVTLTGGQKGTVREDWWFTVSSGLPVRMERHITILSGSPLGTITYDETGSWQMTSLQPRT